MFPEQDYLPLELMGILQDLPLSCDLYINERGRYTLYREASLPFTSDDCKRLLASGVTRLWVSVGGTDRNAITPQVLRALLALPDERFSPRAKARILYEHTLALVHSIGTNQIRRETLADVDDLVSLTIDFLTNSASAFHSLVSTMMHDFSVYIHAVNVASYSLALGRAVGISNRESLQKLGVGALLHDVGKARVPEAVLRKPGPLSPEEWSIMRMHPIWGMEALSGGIDVPEDVVTIVGQHHERLDGSGYPNGIMGGRLHPLAGIVSLADSYDAMTCLRPYRSPFTPFKALSLLKSETAGKINPYLFPKLVLLLGQPHAAA